MAQLSTIDELASQIVLGVDVQDIGQIIPQLIQRIEKYDLGGVMKKYFVMKACELAKQNLTDEQNVDFAVLMKFADTLVDGIITVANSKVFRKTKWCKR